MIEAEQVFPYPEVLNADQKETLQMLVGSLAVSSCKKKTVYCTFWEKHNKIRRNLHFYLNNSNVLLLLKLAEFMKEHH